MAVRQTGFPRNIANGVAGLGPDGRALTPNLPIRRAQVLAAARPVLVAAGGSMAAFVAAQGDLDDTTGAYEAANVEPFAPAGGPLSASLAAYLAGLGQTAAQAAAALVTIWTNAQAISP